MSDDQDKFCFNFIYPSDEKIKNKTLIIDRIGEKDKIPFQPSMPFLSSYAFTINGITFFLHKHEMYLVCVKKQDDGSYSAKLSQDEIVIEEIGTFNSKSEIFVTMTKKSNNGWYNGAFFYFSFLCILRYEYYAVEVDNN